MQLEMVNPFVEASYDTIHEFIQEELKRSDITLLDKDSIVKGVAIRISFKNKKDSAVIVNMDEKVATEVVSKLMGEEISDWDEVAISALAEVGNLLSGRAVTKLEAEDVELDIDPPEVIFTKDSGEFALSDESMNVILDTSLGQIQVIVYFSEVFV